MVNVITCGQLNWLGEANARGSRIFGQAASARVPVRMTLEDCIVFGTMLRRQFVRAKTGGLLYGARQIEFGSPPSLRGATRGGHGPGVTLKHGTLS
jgi:hypothetical protein